MTDTADCVNAVSMLRTMVGEVGMDNCRRVAGQGRPRRRDRHVGLIVDPLGVELQRAVPGTTSASEADDPVEVRGTVTTAVTLCCTKFI